MVFILVRKKKVTVYVYIRGVRSETADAFDLEETCQHPQKRLECSVPDRSQPSGDVNVGNTIWNTGGSLPKLLRAGSAALAEREVLTNDQTGVHEETPKRYRVHYLPGQSISICQKGSFSWDPPVSPGPVREPCSRAHCYL